MKKLIEKLLKGEGRVSLLLLEAKEFADSSKDDKFIEFINNELNGYTEKEIPPYRKISCEIVGNVVNSFGYLEFKDLPIDFSKFSDMLGYDISYIMIRDAIGFIENNLNSVKGPIALAPIPSQSLPVLNKVYEYNNPGLKLISVSHRFSTFLVQNILDKVREELVLNLRRLAKNQNLFISNPLPLDKMNRPISIFVTYAWESEKFNDQIISFVEFLRTKGYDATMDKKKTQEEASTNLNKMMMEGIQKSDKVIVVLTNTYKQKAENFDGGVDFEYQLIIEELKTSSTKFIFVSFGEEIEKITPIGLKGREILDLKKDQDAEFNTLFSKIEKKNIIEFSKVNLETTEIKRKKIKPFKL